MQIAPYVSERRKRRKKVRRYVFGTLAVFVLYFLFFGVAWFFMRTPLFRVGRVNVTGAPGVADADVIALVQADPSGKMASGEIGAILGWRNMLAWPGRVPSSTLALAPQFSDVTVSKDYFSHTVTIAVTERQPFGIWCYQNDGQCYWFDDDGVLFGKSLNTEGNLIVMVDDGSQSDRGLGSTVLPPEFNDDFISIMNVLRATGLGIKRIDLHDLALEEVDVQTAEGPVIEFSLRFPANDYLTVLKNLIAQGGFSKLQYMDCRTQDRVFYK